MCLNKNLSMKNVHVAQLIDQKQVETIFIYTFSFFILHEWINEQN